MKKYIIFTLTLSFIIIYLFYNSKETILITKENIDLFINTLLPTLFPYMILVLLFINYKCHLILSYLLQYISIPLFNISGKSFSIILIGLIGGYPLLALLGKEIINEENKDEINKIIPLFSFPSLSFLYNIIFNNIKINFFIIFLVSSFIILFISKDNKKKKYLSLKDISIELNSNISFLNTFSKVIIKVLNNLGLIFSNLLLFSLFITLFNFKNEKINYVFLGLFEFSRSSIYISNNINNILDINILCLILLFGGLSVIFQIITIYSESLLSFKKYFKYRLILIIITLILLNIY